MTKQEESTKYLIIGNSAGGIGAAEALRQGDKKGSLTVISDEPYPVYSRPLIAEYLTGEVTLEKMLFRPRDFYARNRIEALLGKKAVSLDLKQHSVALEDGKKIFWEKLLLACGGTPVIPGTSGVEKKGVFSFTTLADAQGLRDMVGTAQRAVVVGAGLVGMSVAESLAKRGLKVSLVMRSRVLRAILDREASARGEEVLRKAGIEILAGRTVSEVLGKASEPDKVGGVALDNGGNLPCDVVVMAMGVVPRLELVQDTGIKVNQGIVVDRHMTTSVPQVYACGDVAEAYDLINEANRLTPVWPNAYMGGRIAGFNMAGIDKEHPGNIMMNSLRYFGYPIISAGIVEPPQGLGYETISAADSQGYSKIVLRHNRVVGMIFLRHIETAGIVYGLMNDRVDVKDFKEKLLEPGFGLVTFPREMRWRRLGLPLKDRAMPVAISKQGGKR